MALYLALALDLRDLMLIYQRFFEAILLAVEIQIGIK